MLATAPDSGHVRKRGVWTPQTRSDCPMQEKQLPSSPSRSWSGCSVLCVLGLVAGTLLTERPAWALQGGEDASTLPVLIDKKGGLAGKLQTSLFFSTTLATKFTESTGVTLNLQYNFIDQLGIEVMGGFYAASEAQILEEIRTKVSFEPVLSDMHQMQWVAAANLVWTPIYGKISFASEWNPTFDLYLLAGGGVVGTTRDIGAGNAAVDRNPQNPTEIDTDAIAPHFNFGGGLRIFIVPEFGIRLDVRNYFHDDPDGGLTAEDGVVISGLTSALVGQVGVQFNFGG